MSVAATIATPTATPMTVSVVRSGRLARLRRARPLSRIRPVAPHRPSADSRRISGAGACSALGRRDLVAHSAITDHEDPVGVGGRPCVVGDEHDRLAQPVARVPQQIEDLDAGREVEVAGRLVGEEDRRRRGERAGKGHSLLLTGAQLVRTSIRLVDQPDEAQELADPLAMLSERSTGDEERERHVLAHRQKGDEVEELEHEPGLAPPGEVRCSSSRAVTSMPSMTTVPLVGSSSPPRSWSIVLLPEPDGTMSATNSPLVTDRMFPAAPRPCRNRPGTS